MINSTIIKDIQLIWDNYILSNKKVIDVKGNEYPNIDESRNEAIKQLKIIIQHFFPGEIDINEFKTNIDSFNKRNNLWGFTAAKGQMFFNQLVKTNEQSIGRLSTLLRDTISEPKNLADALIRVERLENFCNAIYSKAVDKRKVPNPGSVGYFLSYFWQIQDARNWPILYTSLVQAYQDLKIWEIKQTQKETYEYFYNLNEEIKNVLKVHSKKDISNWDLEHAFWFFKGNPNKSNIKKKEIPTSFIVQNEPKLSINASFKLTDYIIPRVSKLIELGNKAVSIR